MAKVWALVFTIYQIPYSIFSKHICLQSGFFSFLELQKSLQDKFSEDAKHNGQDVKAPSIHHFWDTLLHFLKTCFNLESAFLLFLEFQKTLQVSFQGCWT